MEYEILSWDDVYNLTLQLSERIVGSGYRPHIIVGIARGGWIPARILSDVLYTDAMFNIRIEYYSDIGRRGPEPKVTQPLSVPIGQRRILLVDEVADTGDSLTHAKGYVEDLGAEEVRTAVLHLKPTSKIEPDYYMQIVDKWMVYPWEHRESIISLVKHFKEEDDTLEMKKIRNKLVFEVGFEPPVADYFIKRL
ncbi:MAG: phosphoribosyltransferase [Candidatus Thorarchaeota archaeon]|nr:MAG: phosphoribosyltransferase [Candidatus Thorarchaeota archaeon]